MSAGTAHVAVVGGGGNVPDPVRVAAEKVGRAVARAGAVLVCGGLGGVMEAACRGARDEGGRTVGILPGLDRAEANPDVEVAIPTGMGEGRNVLVVRAADAVVAVDGEYGTLSEIALALHAGIPVVGLDTWELARAGVADDGVVRAQNPDQAVTLALELARELARDGGGARRPR